MFFIDKRGSSDLFSDAEKRCQQNHIKSCFATKIVGAEDSSNPASAPFQRRDAENISSGISRSWLQGSDENPQFYFRQSRKRILDQDYASFETNERDPKWARLEEKQTEMDKRFKDLIKDLETSLAGEIQPSKAILSKLILKVKSAKVEVFQSPKMIDLMRLIIVHASVKQLSFFFEIFASEEINFGENFQCFLLLQESCQLTLEKLILDKKRLSEFRDLQKFLGQIVNKLCDSMSAVCAVRSGLYFVKRLIDLLAEQCFSKENLTKEEKFPVFGEVIAKKKKINKEQKVMLSQLGRSLSALEGENSCNYHFVFFWIIPLLTALGKCNDKSTVFFIFKGYRRNFNKHEDLSTFIAESSSQFQRSLIIKSFLENSGPKLFTVIATAMEPIIDTLLISQYGWFIVRQLLLKCNNSELATSLMEPIKNFLPHALANKFFGIVEIAIYFCTKFTQLQKSMYAALLDAFQCKLEKDKLKIVFLMSYLVTNDLHKKTSNLNLSFSYTGSACLRNLFLWGGKTASHIQTSLSSCTLDFLVRLCCDRDMCLAMEAFFASKQVPLVRKEDILNKILRKVVALVADKFAARLIGNLVKTLDSKLKCYIMDVLLANKYAISCARNGNDLLHTVRLNFYEASPKKWAEDFSSGN